MCFFISTTSPLQKIIDIKNSYCFQLVLQQSNFLRIFVPVNLYSKINMGILLADDEANLRDIIIFNLQQEGYNVFAAHNGKEALEIFNKYKNSIHLVLLDVSMPQINGFDVCKEIKKISPNTPIIFLTVRNEREDKIFGLKLGADDYLTKPFDLEELLLKVKKITSRYEISKEITLNHRTISFDTFTIILPDKKEHLLSLKESALLKYFISNPNKPLSRQKIIESVWMEKSEEASYRTIDNFVVLFRKIFEDNPKKPKHFISIRGIGYLFKP